MNLYQIDTGRAVLAAHDCGVGSLRGDRRNWLKVSDANRNCMDSNPRVGNKFSFCAFTLPTITTEFESDSLRVFLPGKRRSFAFHAVGGRTSRRCPPTSARRTFSSLASGLRRSEFESAAIDLCKIRSGGEGGIRTLGTLLGYGALAKRCFRPLSHLTHCAVEVARISGPFHARQPVDALPCDSLCPFCFFA